MNQLELLRIGQPEVILLAGLRKHRIAHHQYLARSKHVHTACGRLFSGRSSSSSSMASCGIINSARINQIRGAKGPRGGLLSSVRMSVGRQRNSVILCAKAPDDDKLAVLITGAAGGTGRIVFEKLLNHPYYEGNALVHTKESTKAFKDMDVPDGRISIADVTKGSTPELDEAFKGISALIICTSAVPKMVSPPKENSPPVFEYKEGQYPEQVDWLGQKAQIDAAKKAGTNQVVIVSSMGGTDKSNRLNALGNGNILIWKRQAEEYLIAQNFPSHTILHPGGLIDEKGGERELVLGADDHLMKESSRSIPRQDVAELCVQCLGVSEAQNRSVDVISKKPGHGEPTTDFEALFKAFQDNCSYENV